MHLPKCFVSIESIEELNVNTAVHQGLHSRAKISRTCESSAFISRLRFPALEPGKSGETKACCVTRIGFRLQHGMAGAVDQG